MHNSQQLFTCIVTILSVLLILSCSQKPPSEKIAIRWETILHSPKEIDYCEINPGFTANELLISYSHSFAIGGGFKIIKTNFRSDGLDVDVLLERENKVISHVKSGQGSIACIQHDFENKTLRTNLLVAEDSTYSWSIIDTPVAGLRKIFFLKDIWLIEGNLNGTGQVFESSNKGISWKKTSLSAKGYKSFFLLNPFILSNIVFCMGSKSYNQRDYRLLLFNTKDREVEEITYVGSFLNYVQPISKVPGLHAIVDGDEINLYSSLNGELRLDKTMEVPQSDCIVKNLYVDGDLLIVTTDPLEIGTKGVSWISYNGGDTWKPFSQEKESKLIYNSMGELFVVDSENNILRGTYSTHEKSGSLTWGRLTHAPN